MALATAVPVPVKKSFAPGCVSGPQTRMKPTKNFTGSPLVDQACGDWPHLPSRTLARKLFADHPGVWSTIEAVRNAIQYRRGRNGHRQGRSKSKTSSFGKSPSTAPRVPWNPHALPKSYEESFEPFVIDAPRRLRALVLSDIHVPYHNTPALSIALQHGQAEGCELVLLNGDTLDFYGISKFIKDPRARKPKEEIEACLQLLDLIDEMFPKARKIWKDGNHDERFEHYLMAEAPLLFDVVSALASLPKILELEARGWEHVGDKRPIEFGRLTVIHGHEYPTPVIGPVNAARGLFLRAKDCALVGHHHQTSEHTDPTIRSKIITTWSTGCLCGLHPKYARFNRWNHGFATIDLSPDKDFSVRNIRIHAGKILN